MSPFQVKGSRRQNWSCKFTKFNDLSNSVVRWNEAWESAKIRGRFLSIPRLVFLGSDSYEARPPKTQPTRMRINKTSFAVRVAQQEHGPLAKLRFTLSAY